MARLTADTLLGIWAAVPLSWRPDFTLDEKSYVANIETAIRAKVHGIYTSGSTGEFYALEFDEFRRMVDIQADLCGRARMPLQVGCCADATGKILRKAQYAAAKPQVGALQVALPYWMDLTDREVLQFFADLRSACPDMPLVHYNIPRAKRFLLAGDYLRLLDAGSNLIGVKFTFAGAHFGALQEALMKLPEVSFFVAEHLMVSAMQLGARGSCSSLVLTNPSFMLEMYRKAKARKWDEAIRMQQRAAAFFGEWKALMERLGEGMIDPVADKGLGVAAGCLQGHQRCRPPYLGWKDSSVRRVRSWLQQAYPELVYPGARVG